MIGQLSTAIMGSMGFGLAASASYLHLRHRVRWAPVALRAGAAVALAVDAVFIADEVRQLGVLAAARQSFDSTLMLATLLGAFALVTHMSGRLRGLDGFLFILATAAQLGSLTVLNKPEMTATDRPWFVSHGLAFALGAACFAAAGAAGIAYLMVVRMLRRKRAVGLLGRVASLEGLERFMRWMPILGLPLFTYGILTGLCGIWHRTDLGRTAWYLDLSFVASLAAWIVYAYLAVGLMYRPSFRGRRAAIWSVCGLALVCIAFVFKELWSPMHN